MASLKAPHRTHLDEEDDRLIDHLQDTARKAKGLEDLENQKRVFSGVNSAADTASRSRESRKQLISRIPTFPTKTTKYASEKEQH
ncbi:hypothetical protein NECAME_18622 [Necator americanus]|uniref:Uncharacterized protein n=1 Tax=Necator americanus TaxID=51031 RepID=W2SW28_NECAM|nr:hypothetical protein NECAME_18622 [Necator americanus]ETN72902.1 hypothetical protein NECAME_18622 [Necator americanus]